VVVLFIMVNFCAIVGCSNRIGRDKGKSFFRLPKVITHQGEETKKLSEERRNTWLARISRADLSTEKQKNTRVCSDHFVSGTPAALYDTKNTDWAPSLGLGHEKCKVVASSSFDRYERALKRKRQRLDDDQSKHYSVILHNKKEYLGEQQNSVEPVFKDVSCQTEFTCDDLCQLEEKYRLASAKLSKLSFSEESMKCDDKKTSTYTGLPNFVTLAAVFNLVEPYMPSSQCNVLTKFQQFMILLIRLRQNLSLEDLAYRFDVSKSTVSRTFLRMLDIAVVRLSFLIKWPEREELRKTMPNSFRQHFGTKVTVVIDCFEVFIEKPLSLLARAQTFSDYKHHNTVKFLIGIAPQGVITYISKAWGGRASDKYITENSGILDNLQPGDIILADRGFNIEESVALYYAEVKIPAFTRGKKQLAAKDVESTRKIASVRIQVERVIGLVRRKYRILQSKLPTDYLSTEDKDGMTTIDKIAIIACALTNTCNCIVPVD